MSLKEEFAVIQGKSEILTVEQAHAWAEKHRDSELASKLEWDNKKAGYQHRLWQIRVLLAIHVRPNTGVRERVSLTIDRTQPNGGYRKIDDVLGDVQLKEVYLADALAELTRVRRKYEQITEFASIWRAIDREELKRSRNKGRKKGDEDDNRPTA